MAAPLPIDQGRLLSGFGTRRGRRTGKPTYHAGVDLGHPAGRGTPVYAVQGGVVERVVDNDNPDWGFKGYGNAVIVRHDPDSPVTARLGHGPTWSMYAHLDKALVSKGQRIAPGHQIGEMGNTTTGKFPGMGVHLHTELRKAKPDGSSPFPGPYKRFNLDPKPWIEATGVRFAERGNMSVGEETEAWYTEAWRGIQSLFATPEREPVSGIDDYPRHLVDGFMVPESALGADKAPQNTYEPVEFDRDVRFGLSPTEWAAAGAGALVLTGIGVGAILRATAEEDTTPNKKRSRRRRRTSRRR